MNRSLPIPKVPFFRNRQPSLAQLDQLLDHFPQASLLLDLGKNSIALANAKATELTAFTRAELIDSGFGDLLPFLPNHVQGILNSSKTDHYFDKLTTRLGSSIEVHVELVPLDSDGSWALVIIEPSGFRVQAAAEERRRSERLSDLIELVKSNQEEDIDNAIQQALEIGQNLSGADILALYLTQPGASGFELNYHLGSQIDLPKILRVDELEEFREQSSWEPGNRASNLFFRAARIAKMGYIRTFPLGEDQEFSGVLVLAAEQGGIPEDNAIIADLLTSAILGIIKHHTKVENLNDRLSSLQRDQLIGETVKESSQDGIILLSSELLIRELNPQAETLLGYATSEIYGQPVNNVLIGPANLVPALQSAQQGISTPNLGEVHIHRRDGVAFLAHLSTIPLIYGKDVEGVIVFLRDLSSREESEVRNQQLEQRALLGEVTAIFAHEVKNPINNISTGLQLMAMNLPSEDPNQEVIGRLLDDCNRLTHLMQSVLTFSRPPENKFQQVALADIIPTLLERWRPRLTRLKVKHEFKSKAENTTIDGDPRALEQVFSNLIANAVEAMKITGGNLTIQIRPSQEEGGRQYIETNVIDDGPGIPPDLIDRIFEPFVTTNRNGTGLGLSIAKRIVTAHKGRINVSSVPGGTVFQVILPLSQKNEV